MITLQASVKQLLEGPNYAHLATLLPDGSPHSIPLWVGLEGEEIAFLTSPSSVKAHNIERDPRVAISLTDREQPFTMATIRGTVSGRIEGDQASEIIDRIATVYTGGPYGDHQDRVVFLVTPERVFTTAL